MKVCVIALDGLEPTLVDSRFPNLLQIEHGTTHVTISKLQTPVLWASFLTGGVDHGVTSMKIHNPVSNFISRLIGYQRATSIMARLNLYSTGRLFTAKDLLLPTIFDLTNKSIAIEVPAYNESEVYNEVRRNTVLVFDDKYSEQRLVNDVLLLFYKEFDLTLKRIDEDWDLFMVHYFVTDTIGHLSYRNTSRLEALYGMINRKIEILKSKIPEGTLVLIVSDHGMRKGLHTREGFYSLNKKIKIGHPDITDFYGLIRVWLER